MRELGGLFEIDPAALAGPESDTLPPIVFATGRGALHAIVCRIASERPGLRVFLPDYVCGSVVRAVDDAGAARSFYRVKRDFRPDLDRLAEMLAGGEPTLVMLVDYFGLSGAAEDVERVRSISADAIVVLDLVQAPWELDKPQQADFAFASWRKAFAVPDGAPVLCGTGPALESPAGEHPGAGYATVAGLAKAVAPALDLPVDAYVRFHELAEREFDERPAYGAAASALMRVLYSSLDLKAAAEARLRNFRVLEGLLGTLSLRPALPLAPGRVPLFLPVRVQRRDAVRATLRDRDVICPVHWPAVPGAPEATHGASGFAETGLSLVIDQRYSEDDMERLAHAVREVGAEPADEGCC